MRVCLMIEGQEGVTWEQWLALARACEEHGVESLFRSDHYHRILTDADGSLDAWATLAALAAVTDRIRLGTLVSPATFRHPSILARVAATVDHVSDGRVELGLGAGWYEDEHRMNGIRFEDAAWRFGLFAEQVEIVARTWTEDGFDFDGEHFRLEGQRAYPRPVQSPLPIVLGGSARPRSAALAARFAQEYNTFATVEECRARRATLDAACVQVGRDPASLALSLMAPYAVIGSDERETRERLERVLELTGDERSPDALLSGADEGWFVGTVEQIAGRLEAYRAAGVTRVFLQHVDHADLSAVETIGRELAPAVAA